MPYLVGTTADEFSDDDYRSFGVDPDACATRSAVPSHDALVAAYGDDYARRGARRPRLRPAGRRACRRPRRPCPDLPLRLRGLRYSGHGAEGAYVFDTVTGGATAASPTPSPTTGSPSPAPGGPRSTGLPAWPEASGGGYLALVPDGPTPHADEPRLARLGALRVAVS